MQNVIPTDKLYRFIETLYFVRWAKHPRWFIHMLDNEPILLEGLEGAAYFDEQNAEKVLKLYPACIAIKAIDLAKEIPVVLKNLPAGFAFGHELHGYDLSDIQVDVRNLTVTEN